MAGGTPVAAVPRGAAAEIVTSDAGVLALDETPGALAAAAQQATGLDRDLVRRSVSRFDKKTMIDRYDVLLSALAGGPPRTPISPQWITEGRVRDRMPMSSAEGKDWTRERVTALASERPVSVLDIGPGVGTYAKLLAGDHGLADHRRRDLRTVRGHLPVAATTTTRSFSATPARWNCRPPTW